MNKIIASKDIFQIFPNLISSNVHVLSSLSWWWFFSEALSVPGGAEWFLPQPLGSWPGTSSFCGLAWS